MFMNYKNKWLFNLLIFPLVTLTPMFIYFIIQSTLGDGTSILPPTVTFTPWIFLFFIPVFLISMLWYYLEINGYKKLKWNAILMVTIFAIGEAFVTFLMYYVLPFFYLQNPDNPSILGIIFSLLFLLIIGITIYNFYFKLIASALSFKGPLSYSIHRIAYDLVPTSIFKMWKFDLDVYLNISNNYYENYSFLFTKKGIYILDFLEIDKGIKVNFEYETITTKEKEISFPSLMINDNFAFATKSIEQNQSNDNIIDIFDSLNKAIISFPEINYAPSSKEKIKVVKKQDNSDYIKNILYRRNHLLEILEATKIKTNLTKNEIEELPIINVLIFEDENKTYEGSNENFIITNKKDFLKAVNELEKLLPVKNNTIKKVRKSIFD